jgi:DNA-binding SARP family transcriptional activator
MTTRSGQLTRAKRPEPQPRGKRRPAPRPPDPALLSAIFDSFPAGMLVVDRTGTVMAYNRAVAETLTKPTAGRDTCCLLFGCRRQLREHQQHECLTQLAIDSGPLSPMRVKPPASINGELWVTGAVLDESASHVVFEIEVRGDPDDLNGNSPSPELRISVLGATEVGTAAEPIGGAWLDQRPGQLLKYLVVQRDRVAQTEEIAEALWPGSAAKAPTNAVRHLVHVLREKLEPGRTRAASAFVLQEGGGYRLNRQTVRVDVDEFEANVRVGLLAFSDGNSGTAEDRLAYRETAENRLASALELYRGDLLADLPYAEWTLVERERLRDLIARSLQALASSRFDERDFDRAEEYMERLAEMEPFDNDVQRQHIALCMERGRYSRASRLYALFRQRMLREFGEAPDFELADIRRELPGGR